MKSKQKKGNSVNPDVSLDLNKKGTHLLKSTFENYCNMPTDRIRLVLHPRMVAQEESCIDYLNQKIDEEEKVEIEKKKEVLERREKVLRVFRERRKSITDLEQRAGVVKIRKGFSNTPFKMTARMKALATPKRPRRWDAFNYSETSGMLIRDQQEALTKLQKASLSSGDFKSGNHYSNTQ